MIEYNPFDQVEGTVNPLSETERGSQRGSYVIYHADEPDGSPDHAYHLFQPGKDFEINEEEQKVSFTNLFIEQEGSSESSTAPSYEMIEEESTILVNKIEGSGTTNTFHFEKEPVVGDKATILLKDGEVNIEYFLVKTEEGWKMKMRSNEMLSITG
ncbi:hypothetical protein [Salibacterium sp. K-3]